MSNETAPDVVVEPPADPKMSEPGLPVFSAIMTEMFR